MPNDLETSLSSDMHSMCEENAKLAVKNEELERSLVVSQSQTDLFKMKLERAETMIDILYVLIEARMAVIAPDYVEDKDSPKTMVHQTDEARFLRHIKNNVLPNPISKMDGAINVEPSSIGDIVRMLSDKQF